MISIGAALMGSIVVAKAWLTLSSPDTSSGSSASGEGTISPPLSVSAPAYPHVAVPNEIYFSPLKFALDLPALIPNLPSTFSSEGPVTDDNPDWLGDPPIHDELPQTSSQTAYASQDSGFSSGTFPFSFLNPFSSGLPGSGIATSIIPGSGSGPVVVAENVPEPDGGWLIAVGVAVLLLRVKSRGA